MANKKRSNSGGGFKGAIYSVLTLLILAGAILGWAKVNNITSVSGVYDYFKSASDKAWECGAGEADWKCDKGGSSGGQSSGGNTGNHQGSDDSSHGSTSQQGSKDEYIQKLDKVAVADAANVDYDRSQWKHWIGSPCNTRETILKDQGSDVKTDPKTCKILSGSWSDPYTGKTITNAGSLDIDHVIPLGYVAAHGGQGWSSDRKQEYANDQDVLLAVDSGENRSKSDKGPSQYMPPNRDFQCDYAKYWVNVSTKYGISITESDKTTLVGALQKCSS